MFWNVTKRFYSCRSTKVSAFCKFARERTFFLGNGGYSRIYFFALTKGNIFTYSSGIVRPH